MVGTSQGGESRLSIILCTRYSVFSTAEWQSGLGAAYISRICIINGRVCLVAKAADAHALSGDISKLVVLDLAKSETKMMVMRYCARGSLVVYTKSTTGKLGRRQMDAPVALATISERNIQRTSRDLKTFF